MSEPDEASKEQPTQEGAPASEAPVPEAAPASEPAPKPEAPEEPQHDVPQEAKETPSAEIKEKPLDEVKEKPKTTEEISRSEEQQKPRSTKRTSIDAKAVNQETFTPPSDRRRSSMNARRVSVGQSDKSLKTPSPSGKARQSRFAGLGSKARMVLGSIVDIKVNAADFYDKKVRYLSETLPFYRRPRI